MTNFDEIKLTPGEDFQNTNDEDWDIMQVSEAIEAQEDIDEGWLTMNSRGCMKIKTINTKTTAAPPPRPVSPKPEPKTQQEYARNSFLPGIRRPSQAANLIDPTPTELKKPKMPGPDAVVVADNRREITTDQLDAAIAAGIPKEGVRILARYNRACSSAVAFEPSISEAVVSEEWSSIESVHSGERYQRARSFSAVPLAEKWPDF